MYFKSIKYCKLLVVFTLILLSLFAGNLFGQKKGKVTAKNKTNSHLGVYFSGDSSILKYIQLYRANVKVKQNRHCDDCLSLKGNLDFKLKVSKGKKYLVIIIANWRSNEQKFSDYPISFLYTRQNKETDKNDTLEYYESNWREQRRYSGLAYKKIANSYFKNDTAKFQLLMKWLNNNLKPWERYDAQLFLSGSHSYAHLGILDENSILRFNLSDLWIPKRKSFFLEDNNGSQKTAKSYENEAFRDNTGFMYKFILFSLTDNEVYESDIIEGVGYSIPKSEVKLVE